MNFMSIFAGRRGALAAMVGVVVLAACEGTNAWTDLPTASVGSDQRAPEVEIRLPERGGRVAVGDSVRLQVRVADDAGLDTLTLSGFSLRGSAELGTQQRVERFATKVISLRDTQPVREATILRDLLATSDSLPENPVYLVARVRDIAGNVSADTVRISIGGPRVRVLSPAAAIELREGNVLRVRVAAADSVNRIQSISVRLTGAVPLESRLTLNPPATSVDTVIPVQLPAGQTGIDTLRVVVRTMANDSSVTSPTLVTILTSRRDAAPPTVRFRVAAAPRAEVDDTVAVTVVATDSSRIQRVGVVFRSSLRFADRTESGASLLLEAGDTDSTTFRLALRDLQLSEPVDTSYVVRLEVTAFAVDAANNCAAATVAGTPLSQACVPQTPGPGSMVSASTTGARTDLVVVRGLTASSAAGDRLVDLVADSVHRRVLVSNYSRGRVEILPFGQASFSSAPIVDVGSRPWGLAIGRGHDTLYVANSGGTNISIVPLTAGRPAEAGRITTPDIRLYSFTYDVQRDSASTVDDEDFSDRPQFLGQLATGQLVYSTVPTSARQPGTVRIYDPGKDVTREFNRATEIFVDYARRVKGKGVVVNALSATLVPGGAMRVCPRKVRPNDADPDCLVETPDRMATALRSLQDAGRTDTRIELGLDIASVGLTDTTFVAVSRDKSTIAFGEGGINPGRVLLFRVANGQLTGLARETHDLVGNAAERVVGLGLNGDGTLGVARGASSTYFFENDLRLQGQVASGPAAGGSALHPLNAAYPRDDGRRRAFVSGVDSDGSPYIEVIDSYYFRPIRKLRIRDRVIGSLIAVPVAAGDPGAGTVVLRLFGITASGIVQVALTAADLR